MELTHFDKNGKAKMVDISDKEDTHRVAVARGDVAVNKETIEKIKAKEITKGDVLTVAKVAGISAAKRTAELIPMCHPILLTNISVDLQINEKVNLIEIESQVKTTGKTGAEMEALTAVYAAALTVYDMCKAVDKMMTISNIRLISKSGGKSGDFKRGKT